MRFFQEHTSWKSPVIAGWHLNTCRTGMNPARAGVNTLAFFAILILLGFGFVAYAVPGPAGPESSAHPAGGASDGSGESQGANALANGLSYALLPTPVYLHEKTPDNYPFKEGGALVVASGDQLQVKTSFIGSPKTDFTTVLQTADGNITVGMATTGGGGGAVFKGNVTLQPGTYGVGLLVFVSGQPASPVGVSVPWSIRVTIPGTGQTSSTTSSPASSTSVTAPPPPQGLGELQFTPVSVPDAPSSYQYGEGSGGYAVDGGVVSFSLAFTGQNPTSEFSLVLSVNGSARTIGQYTTSAKGGGSVAANATLGAGRFVVGLTVDDSSTFALPTAVLSSIPSSFIVDSNGSVTTTTKTSAPRGLAWTFKLAPAAAANTPEGYRFATTGTAMVSLDQRSSLLSVELGFQDANPSTTYDATLVLNGSSVDLGSMTTNRQGEAVLHASIQLSPGRYLLGIMVYDVSDVAAFKAGGPVLVLVSDPSTQVAVIVPPNAEVSLSTSATTSNESQVTSTSSSAATSAVTKTATTIDAGTEVQSQIQDAVDNLTIPASVQVTPLLSSTAVLDPRFSLSVGQQVGNGLVIAISGENVTGPRVLLINMSKTAPLALYPALNVTLDGAPVAEASSAIQVLNPVSTDPPMYVLVATSNSIQLLLSIPHFSLHLIQVAGVVVRNIAASLELDAPLLAGSILVITLAFLGAYAARKRYFSILL
jgi:hypothetical protein